MNKISITRKISRELVHIKRSTFEGSKVNVPQVAFFDKNMAVGKSENLVMLHVYKLETDHSTFLSSMDTNLVSKVPRPNKQKNLEI